MKPKLLIVTSNPMKFKELADKLSEFFVCEQVTFDEPEIQGSSEEILNHKVKRAYEIFQQPLLVDDVSVHFGDLGGFPGPYMKDFFKHMTPYEIGVKLVGSTIQTICRLAFCKGKDDIIIAEGVLNGIVITPKKTDHEERHFDLFTQAEGMDRPMIEYSVEEKNKFSHRGKAIDNLVELLRGKQ